MMNAKLVEQRGVVHRVENGQAFVAMTTSGCASCGHGSSCGIGRLASGRASSLLAFEVGERVEAGDQVGVVLREGCLTVAALVGYLFPAFAMLLGAWAGAHVDGSDGASALGAIAGFLAALAIVRLTLRLVPALLSGPRLIRRPPDSAISQQEFHHER